MMIRFLKRIHACWYIFSVVFSFLLFLPFFYFYSRKPSRYPTLNCFRKGFGFLSSALAGVFYKPIYEETIVWNRPYIVCANHTSNLDIAAITGLMYENFAFLGKEELLRNPVLSIFFKTIDIPVNRESKIASFRAFKKADEYLQHGLSLVIFPEGKIGNEYPPILHPFKNGPFRLAIERGIPIIPVTIDRLWELMWDNGFVYGSKPGKRNLYVHAPIDTSAMSIDDADALKDLVYAKLQQNYFAKS
ncbi:MAG: lysophospholipid acyltransferase family protein [Sphingobacteriaceae bacterium]